MSEYEMQVIEEIENPEDEWEDVDMDEYRESYEDYISSYIY